MRARMLLLASALGGCAATQSVTADTTDYDLYRRTRTATSSEARLRASFDYLERAPDGRWRPEVKAWFDRAEPLYWERMQTSVGGLRAYLATLPRGPHGKLAAERVLEQRAGARMDQARDRELLDDALSVEQRLADADQMRKTVVRELGEWTARLATIPSFGKPTSELPHETIHHYRVLEPVARCADERCKKTLALPYAIPDGKRLSARKALLDVELGLYRGNVVRARLAGPELWSRLYECSDRTPVGADDAQARTEAIARAVQIVESALGPRFAEASCQREAVSPWVLERECRGVRIRMQAALTPETDDEITVEPVQQP